MQSSNNFCCCKHYFNYYALFFNKIRQSAVLHIAVDFNAYNIRKSKGENLMLKIKNCKKKTAKFIKKTAYKAASYSCGAASMYGARQPKEPENLKSFLANK